MGEYIETQLENGGTITEWISPPLAPTHKTSGINKTEWRRHVLTSREVLRNDKAESFIEGDLTWLTESIVNFDDIIDVVAHAPLAAFAGSTYRDALRSTFKSFKDAPSLSTADSALQAGVYLQSITGLLDDPARVPVILQGVPL